MSTRRHGGVRRWQRPRPQCVLELFIAARLGNLIGGSRLVSGAGLVATLHREPATLFQVDEFGQFLRLVIDKRKAPKHLAEIWDYLTELTTTAGSTWKGAEYADQSQRPRIDIVQPCCCIHATTVQAVFWSALQSGSHDRRVVRTLVAVSDGRSNSAAGSQSSRARRHTRETYCWDPRYRDRRRPMEPG